MKTRIISRLLIAREEDTLVILCIFLDFYFLLKKENVGHFVYIDDYFKSICNRIRIRFFTFSKFTPEIFINENKNYLSIIN